MNRVQQSTTKPYIPAETLLVTNGFPQVVTHPSTNQVHGCLNFSDQWPHDTNVANKTTPLGKIKVGMWLLLLLRHSTRDGL